MKIDIEITTINNGGIQEIFGKPNVMVGATVSDEVAVAELTKFEESFGIGFGEAFDMTIEFLSTPAGQIPIAVMANWIFELMKNKARSLKLKGKTYRVTLEDIERMLRDADQSE